MLFELFPRASVGRQFTQHTAIGKTALRISQHPGQWSEYRSSAASTWHVSIIQRKVNPGFSPQMITGGTSGSGIQTHHLGLSDAVLSRVPVLHRTLPPRQGSNADRGQFDQPLRVHRVHTTHTRLAIKLSDVDPNAVEQPTILRPTARHPRKHRLGQRAAPQVRVLPGALHIR
ncbi:MULTISPECIES: hypothetical protein, partial [Streptomyces]|uniref:hypothetical protein n=1 Tax=Streptomyces lycopersici TaxID=2974589 RepID=UPI0021D26597